MMKPLSIFFLPLFRAKTVVVNGNFDSYKKWATPKSSSSSSSLDWPSFQVEFVYETQFAQRLDKKHLILTVLSKGDL